MSYKRKLNFVHSKNETNINKICFNTNYFKYFYDNNEIKGFAVFDKSNTGEIKGNPFEFLYNIVATNRRIFSKLTLFFYGKDYHLSELKLTRKFFYRGLMGVFFIAFLSLFVQYKGLFASNGIVPISLLMKNASLQLSDTFSFFKFPTLFWINSSDIFILSLLLIGIAVSLLGFFMILPGLTLCFAWFIYLSFVLAGSPFMSFQWDILLCELGFLTLFYVPFLNKEGFNNEPSHAMQFLFRLILIKLYLTSGLVKIFSGDITWSNLTALNYHYYTQPLPHIGAWLVYQLPDWFHKISTFLALIIELFVPLLLFFPRRIRFLAFFPLILLQVMIILTGNYNFFNILTILLIVVSLDDTYFKMLIPKRFLKQDVNTFKSNSGFRGKKLVIIFALVMMLINIQNECSRFLGWRNVLKPITNPLRSFYISNQYGLFANMTTVRNEIEIQGSLDGKTWFSYEFHYKPQALDSGLAWVQPYQPRLDWQMWFAALSRYQSNPWFYNLLLGLVQNNKDMLSLIKSSPFPDYPPKYLRCLLKEYEFTSIKERVDTGNYWKVVNISEYTPQLEVN